MSLRPDFTFASFVRIPSAAQARRLCARVGRVALRRPQVLVLHGPAGTGKTHLLHAMGQVASIGGRRVGVMTARDLARELLEAIRIDRIGPYRAQVPGFDVLIVDDLQELLDKPATLGELGRTLAGWSAAGVAIAGASSAPAEDLSVFTSAFKPRSRIRWTGVKAPRQSERRVIASALLDRQGIQTTRANVGRIVKRCGGDVRRIVGAIASLRAASELPGGQRTEPAWLAESSARRAS